MSCKMMTGFIASVMLCCCGCVENLVYYPPRSDIGSAEYFVIIDKKPIGRQRQEVFVTVYGQPGNVYALREYEFPVDAKDTLRWEVTWERVDQLKVVFHTYKYTVGHDELMTRDMESYRVFTLSMTYDAESGTFVEAPDSDLPVQKRQT